MSPTSLRLWRTFFFKIGGKKFEQASKCATQVGISDVAMYDENGVQADAIDFPYKLILTPTSAVQQPEKVASLEELHAGINSIPSGTKMFDVYGCAEAGDHEHEKVGSLEKSCVGAQKIGEISLESQCTNSEYGDKHFFIRHTQVESDWAIKKRATNQQLSVACGRDWSELKDRKEFCK